MEATQEELESTKSYILGLCSAIGGLEEIKLPDGSVGQVYCPGDEALGMYTSLLYFFFPIIDRLLTTIISLFEGFEKSCSYR